MRRRCTRLYHMAGFTWRGTDDEGYFALEAEEGRPPPQERVSAGLETMYSCAARGEWYPAAPLAVPPDPADVEMDDPADRSVASLLWRRSAE